MKKKPVRLLFYFRNHRELVRETMKQGFEIVNIDVPIN